MTVCLIIEESDTIRAIAVRLASALGVRTIEAPTAAAALKAIAAERPDLVLLDWELPKLGAVDFLKAYAEADDRPPVVLTATENDPQQMALARAAGVAGYLFKPYDANQLAGVLDELGLPYGEAAKQPAAAAKPAGAAPKKPARRRAPRAKKTTTGA